MKNKDFMVAVTKFFYYANNYNCVEITYPTWSKGEVTEYQPDFFQAFEPHIIEHMVAKYDYWYKKFGGRSGAALIEFFSELDGSNRARLLKWANENYNQSEDFGINLSMAE